MFSLTCLVVLIMRRNLIRIECDKSNFIEHLDFHTHFPKMLLVSYCCLLANMDYAIRSNICVGHRSIINQCS